MDSAARKRRLIFRHRLGDWSAPAAILLTTFGFIALIGGAWHATAYRAVWDVSLAPLRTVRSTILKEKGISMPVNRGMPGTQTYTLQIHGEEAEFPSVQRFREGQTVAVRYRVGKSGRVYIETVAPVAREL
jgi:hypothetical protein